MKNPRLTNRDYLAVAIRDGHPAELAPPVAMRSLRM